VTEVMSIDRAAKKVTVKEYTTGKTYDEPHDDLVRPPPAPRMRFGPCARGVCVLSLSIVCLCLSVCVNVRVSRVCVCVCHACARGARVHACMRARAFQGVCV